MKPSLTLTHRGIILVLVPLLFGLTSLAILGDLLRQAESDLSASYRNHEISVHAENVSREFSDTGIALGGYAETGNVFFKDRYQSLSSRILSDLSKLYAAVGQDPVKQKVVRDLEIKLKDGLSKLSGDWDELNRSNQVMRRYLSAKIYIHVQELADGVQSDCDKLIKIEELQESGSDIENRSRARLKTFLGAVIALNILLSLILARFFTNSIGKRLKVVSDNSVRLAVGQELHPEMQGTDEIAQLDRGFHEMSALLMEMSRRERAIIENAVDVICSIDSDGKFIAVSPSVASWGYSAADLLGSRFVNVVEETWVDETLKVMSSARENKAPLSFENALVRKDGSILAVQWTGSWSDTDQALFCVVHDMTERKKLEKLRDEFVAMITHDLRTPLTSVQIFHEMLGLELLGNLNDEGLRSLTQAQSSISRLLNMVSDLLDYEKLKAGEMQLALKQSSLSSIVEESVNAVTPFAAKHNIQFEMPQTSVVLNADGERLVRVLVNLLSNAVKFSPDGSVVKIDIAELGSSVKVSIIDSGAGIPIEHQASIFEKYKQSGKSKKMQGTGLGLPICKAIIESHGGKIGVVSEPGKGSVFWFELPVQVVI